MASLVSLLIHALILSLEFGIPGLGLPGLQAPWSERRAHDEPLHLRLAEANKPAPVTDAGATGAVPAIPSGFSGSDSTHASNPVPAVNAREHHAALPPMPARNSAALSILPPQENLPPPSDAGAPRTKARAKQPERLKPRPKAGKQKRPDTALAKQSRRPIRQAGSAPQIIAQAKPESDSFAMPPVSEMSASDDVGDEIPETQESSKEIQPAAVASDAINSDDEQLADSGELSEPESELAQVETHAASQAAALAAKEMPAEEAAAKEEARMQADAMRLQEEAAARLAEQLALQRAAEENEISQARERRQHAEDEARRLAQQEQEEQRVREAQQLAAMKMEESMRRAEIDAQRELELRASQQAAQRLEEEARREQELAARMKAEEEARRVLAAEEQTRAEMAAREQANQQMRAEAEQRAHQLAMQEQHAAAAQQAEQEAQEALNRAQAPAAPRTAQGQVAFRQGDADQANRGTSQGGSSGRSANASGDGSENQARTRDDSTTQTGKPAQMPAAPKEHDQADQPDDGPIMLTDAQLDSVKVAQIRTVDKTRLDTWEVRDLESDAPTARRRSLLGRAQDDIVLKMYVDDWERQVEKIAASQDWQPPTKTIGHALVTVSLRSDGSLENIVLHRSTGQPELDQAIKELAGRATQKIFPRDLARRYDVIEIRRIWDFKERLRLREAAP